METQSSTQQPKQEPYRPRLERPRDDRVVAGVASGLARHLGIDAAWVRMGFVVLALFGGTGILAYLIGWIAIPEVGQSESELTKKARHAPRLGNWIGIGLIVVAGLILVGETSLVDGEVVFAGALIVLGILIYRGDLTSLTEAGESEETSPGTSPSAWIESGLVGTAVADGAIAEQVAISPEPSVPTEPPPPPAAAFQPRPVKPRESSALGRLGFATILIIVGIMGVGQSASWWDPLPRHYVGAVVATIGATLLIGSLFGRARWLIVLGLVTAPFLFAGALLDVPLDGGFGEPSFEPQTVDELRSEYRLIGGDMTLDLLDVELAAGDSLVIDASVAFGRLEVLIPDGMGVDVFAEVDGGEVRIDGSVATEGLNVETGVLYEGTGLLDLDLHVGFGQIEIREVEVQP